MSQSNDELAAQLKGLLGQTGLNTAFVGEEDQDSEKSQTDEEENPLETDFFKALNAFRAARTQGDPQKMADAEEYLRQVVRGELTKERCEE